MVLDEATSVDNENAEGLLSVCVFALLEISVTLQVKFGWAALLLGGKLVTHTHTHTHHCTVPMQVGCW